MGHVGLAIPCLSSLLLMMKTKSISIQYLHVSTTKPSFNKPISQRTTKKRHLNGLQQADMISQAQYSSRPRTFATAKSQFLRSSKPQIPANSWDSHMHVTSPDYPLDSSAQYTPKSHSLSDAITFEKSQGVANIVLVQPSIYGTDNSCMLDALQELGTQRARAVVVFDPAHIDKATLEQWHKMGVRGARVNLVSVGQQISDTELQKILTAHADVIRPYNWVLNLHVPMTAAAALESIIPTLGVNVVLDHFCQPALPAAKLQRTHPYTLTRDPYAIEGFRSLVNLLVQGNTYVKLSAPYRISKEEGQVDLDPIGRELVKVALQRCIWASDWPHTRFDGVEAGPFVKKVIGWCEEMGGGRDAVEMVFRGNAERLWGVRH